MSSVEKLIDAYPAETGMPPRLPGEAGESSPTPPSGATTPAGAAMAVERRQPGKPARPRSSSAS
ncbi:hypothetical protein WJ438_04845 [Streptomyces sp. GD-15H]|uniref:hypothetical protein n=1 Tax=Streptomyces sp. GD-15H TaxID=3129112 RepID=UPI00324436AC